MVVESYGDLDGKTRSAIRRVAATAHVEDLAYRAKELCATFDELDEDGLSTRAQDSLWRARSLLEDASSALDEVVMEADDGQSSNNI